MKNDELKEKLIVGARIQIGKLYAEHTGCDKEGDVLTLIKGSFEEDNGLYTYESHAPSIWNEDLKEFDSIYHLFGNNFEYFYDCKIL